MANNRLSLPDNHCGGVLGRPRDYQISSANIPVDKKYKIDYYISGHDHSSQVIHDNRNFNDTVFLIAGAPSFVNIHSASRARPLPGGGDLVWFDDRNIRVVLYLEFSPEIFEYKFVKLTYKGEEIIMSGTK